MSEVSTESVVRDLQFDADEALVLVAFRQLMLGRDLIADRSPARVAVKTQYRDEFARAALQEFWSRGEALPGWAHDSAEAIRAKVPAHQRAAIEKAATDFGPKVALRSRALLMLIELVAYQPWTEGVTWAPRPRRDALAAVAGHLTALRASDLDAVMREFAAVSRAVARCNVRWGRVAAASAAGLALGVATMGAAAPLIGAAVGGALGMSGAAATSAGLAALGGGSIAAGGLGMAGGTAVLAGIGALGGVGAAAAGSRLSGWSAGQVVAEAITLDVVTRLVILDAEGDDEKARRVVEGLQARLDEVSAKIRRLSEQLRRLTADNQRLSVENEQLRARWKDERADAAMAEVALQVVIERIPVGHGVAGE